MGSRIVKNLLSSGHQVIIWNRDKAKAKKFEDFGAKVAATPCDVANQADVIFSCVSDPLASKEVRNPQHFFVNSQQTIDVSVTACLRTLWLHIVQ